MHQQASLYVTDEAFGRWRDRQLRNAALLSECIAINEAGDELTLAELAEKSTSNPAVRRNELMVRIRGFEDYANQQGNAAIFVTWTAPGYMHAVSSKGYRVNAQGAALSPREAQRNTLGAAVRQGGAR